jgi:hypothetical protein
MFGCGGKSSLISESVTEIRINRHLARRNLTTRRMHCLHYLMYGYLLLSSSEVENAPLRLGWNIGSTVCARPCHRPGLPHSPSNNHNRVAVQFNTTVIEPTRFTGCHKSRMHQYIIDTCSSRPNTTRCLIDIGEGYHRGVPNIFLSTLTLPIRWYSTCSPLVSSPSIRLRFLSTL